MSQRIALKLALYSTLLGILIGAAIALVEIRVDYSRSTTQIIDTAEQMVELTLNAATEAVFELDTELAENLLSGLMQNELFLAAEIYDELGQKLAGQYSLRKEFTPLQSLIAIDPVELNYELAFGTSDGNKGRFVALLDVQAGLSSFYDLALITASAQLVEAIGLSFLIFLMVAILIANPVRKLAEQLSVIEPGSDARLETDKAHAKNEIGGLISSANKYLDATTAVQNDLARSRQELQNILDNLKEGIAITDIAGRVVRLNPAVVDLLGHDNYETRTVGLCELLSYSEFDNYSDLFSHVADVNAVEIQTPDRNGSMVSVELSVTVIEFENRRQHLWAIRDTSERVKAEQERKKLEAQLTHSQKMEAVGTLAGGIAHDFNNLLGGISGFAEMAMGETPADSNSQMYLKNILKGSDKATQLINRILAFSHKQEEQMMPLNLDQVLDDCIFLIEQTIPTSISISKELKGSRFTIFADEAMMTQIIMNLFTNASSAIGNVTGRIHCVLENLESEAILQEERFKSANDDLSSGSGIVRLSVSDTGSGIPQENLHRIFEPYFTTKKLGTGTGLGLAVTHTLVEKHNGHIDVNSSEQGTCFTIDFPCLNKHSEEQSVNQFDSIPATKGSECILVVEDNEMLADMLAHFLSSLGYIPILSSNGNDALKKYTQSKGNFDLVITDQTMPNMNGDVLIENILEMNPEQPVILCTGFSDSINEEQALAMGVKHFLMKPVSIHSLSRLVREVLDQEAA